MSRPTTDQTKIIFPYSLGRYSKNEFNMVLAQGRVIEADIDEVLDEVHSLPDFKIEKPKVIYVLPFLMMCVMAFIVIFMVGFASSLSDSAFFVIPLVPIGSMIFFFVVSACVTHYAGRKMTEQMNRRQHAIQGVLNRYNQLWSSREVSWRIGTMGAWLRLDLDFMIRAMQNNLLAAGGVGGGIASNQMMGGFQPAGIPMALPPGNIGTAAPYVPPGGNYGNNQQFGMNVGVAQPMEPGKALY